MAVQVGLLERIVAYSREDDRIFAVVLIGSHARTGTPADVFSDLDLVLVVEDPKPFLVTDTWLEQIGTLRLSFTEPTIGGDVERRVVFDDALDVDFLLLTKATVEAALPDGSANALLSRGYRLLLDKAGYDWPMREPVSTARYAIPSADTFVNLVQDFWFHAMWSTKKWLRGELWAAKNCVDGYMKSKLLWMIEQYEHTIHGPEYDTWFGGRFLDRWADDTVISGLKRSYATYSETTLPSALLATMELFRTLATHVSDAYSFPYPAAADKYSSDWVERRLRCES